MYRAVALLIGAAVVTSSIQEQASDPPDKERIGFDPAKWGPSVWLSLHLMALNQPPAFGSSIRAFERYLYSLQSVLPCRQCRDELRLVLRAVPPRTFLKYGRIGAVAYIYTVHCIVSDRVKQNAVCATSFLQEEERYLRDFMKPGSIDVAAEMAVLREAARGLHMDVKIEAAKLAWKKASQGE